jgi:hypothetical protein
MNGPSTQQFLFSSSDLIATICFDHTTIIKRPPDNGHMTETCCANKISGGEEELLR